MAEDAASLRARAIAEIGGKLDADIAKNTPDIQKQIKKLLDAGFYRGVVPQFQAAAAQAANADADDIPDRQDPEIIIARPNTLKPATEKIFIKGGITRFGIRVTANRWYMIREDVANENALFNKLKIYAEQILEDLKSRVVSDYLTEIKSDWNLAHAQQRYPADIATLKQFIASQRGDQEISAEQLDNLAIQYANSNYETIIQTFENPVLRTKFIDYTRALGLWTTNDEEPQLLFQKIGSLYDQQAGVQIYPPEHKDYKQRMDSVKEMSGFYPENAILAYKWSADALDKDADRPAREIADFRTFNRMLEVRKLEKEVLQISVEEKEDDVQPDPNINALRRVLLTPNGELNEAGIAFFNRLYDVAQRAKEVE